MNWKLEQAKLRKAAELGEAVAKAVGFDLAPVDPFAVVHSEGRRLQALGDNFRDAFDGRLEYHGAYFLLLYNTKYDGWDHEGSHHPKVTFTVAHELGHYFLEDHRHYLMGGGGPHWSQTDFESSNLAEREADFFATGLLMPQYLLRKRVNTQPPTLSDVRRARSDFRVSLTSMMIRWVQLCDFPCAVTSVVGDKIEWGFTSPGFKRIGAYVVRRGERVSSRQACSFLAAYRSAAVYREGDGWSVAERWLELERHNLEVHENYVVVPSTRQMLVFLTADEDEAAADSNWE